MIRLYWSPSMVTHFTSYGPGRRNKEFHVCPDPVWPTDEQLAAEAEASGYNDYVDAARLVLEEM